MIPPATSATAPAPPAAGGSSTSAQIKKAAEQFEGILINTLWSSFQQDPLFGSEDDDSDPGAESMRGLGLQAVSSAMAKAGGLGIGHMIEKQLDKHSAAAAYQAAAPAEPAGVHGSGGTPVAGGNAAHGRVNTSLKFSREKK